MEALLSSLTPGDWIDLAALGVTALLAIGTFVAAIVAKRSADIAVLEFRLARRPSVDISWVGEFAYGLASRSIRVIGTVRDTVGQPTTLHSVDYRVTPMYGPIEDQVPRWSGRYQLGWSLRGKNTRDIEASFPVEDDAIAWGPGEVHIRLEVTMSVVTPYLETWTYQLNVRFDTSTIVVDEAALEIGTTRHQRHGATDAADALQRAWKGGLSP